MTNEKTSLDYYLLVKMMDEMANFVVSVRNLEDNPEAVLKDTAQPEDRFQLLANFDPYKYINSKEFILNMGSLVVAISNKMGFSFSPEYAVVMEYLKENSEQLYLVGDLIQKFNDEKDEKDNANPFYV